MNVQPQQDFDQRTLARFLNEIMRKGEAHELCFLHAQFDRRGYIVRSDFFSSTVSGWYEDPKALLLDALRGKGVSAYVVANPITRDLMARSSNKLMRLRAGDNRTRSENILNLRWMYIDIDPVRPSGISATDAELHHAISRRDAILGDFPEFQQSCLWGRSGNGTWILSRLPDYPNDEEHHKYISYTLGSLSKIYSDDLVSIDVKTKDPCRLMCLPGTLKCKGESLPDRPWRLATLDSPDRTIPDAAPAAAV